MDLMRHNVTSRYYPKGCVLRSLKKLPFRVTKLGGIYWDTVVGNWAAYYFVGAGKCFLVFTQTDLAMAFRTLSLLFVFVPMPLVCWVNVSNESKVTPRIFELYSSL